MGTYPRPMTATTPSLKQTKPRPTGTTKDEYAGHEKWTYRRWAWEFLRRNPEFIKACKLAKDDLAKQVEVASEFGLKRFKPHTEAYGRDRRLPVFLSAAVGTWSAVDASRKRNVSVTLREGQVLVRFNLAAGREDARAIQAQLVTAEKTIRALQRKYMQAIAAEEPAASESKPMYFVRHLRLLDLLGGKESTRRLPGRALRWVNEHPKTRMSNAEALDKHHKQIEQAQELCLHGYRHLATRPGTPTPKCFV